MSGGCHFRAVVGVVVNREGLVVLILICRGRNLLQVKINGGMLGIVRKLSEEVRHVVSLELILTVRHAGTVHCVFGRSSDIVHDGVGLTADGSYGVGIGLGACLVFNREFFANMIGFLKPGDLSVIINEKSGFCCGVDLGVIKTGVELVGLDLLLRLELVGDRLEGEAELQVGVEHTALHVVDGHGVRGVGAVVVEPTQDVRVVSGCTCLLLCIVRCNRLAGEVDFAFCSFMRTAQVEDELAVDEYPQVVVSGESKHLICIIVILTAAADGERNLQLHADALVMHCLGAVACTIPVKRSKTCYFTVIVRVLGVNDFAVLFL